MHLYFSIISASLHYLGPSFHTGQGSWRVNSLSPVQQPGKSSIIIRKLVNGGRRGRGMESLGLIAGGPQV